MLQLSLFEITFSLFKIYMRVYCAVNNLLSNDDGSKFENSPPDKKSIMLCYPTSFFIFQGSCSYTCIYGPLQRFSGRCMNKPQFSRTRLIIGEFWQSFRIEVATSERPTKITEFLSKNSSWHVFSFRFHSHVPRTSPNSRLVFRISYYY